MYRRLLGDEPESGAYNLPACEVIAIIFMLLGSLNFAFFFLVITGRARQALRSDELKFFLGAVVVVSLLVFGNILPTMTLPATHCGTRCSR